MGRESTEGVGAGYVGLFKAGVIAAHWEEIDTGAVRTEELDDPFISTGAMDYGDLMAELRETQELSVRPVKSTAVLRQAKPHRPVLGLVVEVVNSAVARLCSEDFEIDRHAIRPTDSPYPWPAIDSEKITSTADQDGLCWVLQPGQPETFRVKLTMDIPTGWKGAVKGVLEAITWRDDDGTEHRQELDQAVFTTGALDYGDMLPRPTWVSNSSR